MKSVEASPKASTLIESMRDIGYSLETALADVVDNSITADLIDAMRLGSRLVVWECMDRAVEKNGTDAGRRRAVQ